MKDIENYLNFQQNPQLYIDKAMRKCEAEKGVETNYYFSLLYLKIKLACEDREWKETIQLAREAESLNERLKARDSTMMIVKYFQSFSLLKIGKTEEALETLEAMK